MKATEGIREAFDTVRHNKLRTMLTILSLVIGVASVIAVMAIGIMGSRAVMDDIGSLGAGVYWIAIERGENWWEEDARRQQYLRDYHVAGIHDLVRDTSWLTPVLRGSGKIGFRNDTADAGLYGVGPEYDEIWSPSVLAGRFLDEDDQRRNRRVIVLGNRVARTLFGDAQSAVGATVQVGRLHLQVVGVLAARGLGSAGDGSDDASSYLLFDVYGAVYEWPASGPHVPEVTMRARDTARLPEAITRVQFFLDRVLPGSESLHPFTVQTDQARLETQGQVLRIVTTVVTLVAGISLLVGGMGIMNIMLVSVSERTREIGLRKAVGARDGDIMSQFLIESVVICLLGGTTGVVLGFGGTLIAALALQWNLVLPQVAAVGLGVSIAIGLFFGVYPASKAARLPPVVALSRE